MYTYTYMCIYFANIDRQTQTLAHSSIVRSLHKYTDIHAHRYRHTYTHIHGYTHGWSVSICTHLHR